MSVKNFNSDEIDLICGEYKYVFENDKREIYIEKGHSDFKLTYLKENKKSDYKVIIKVCKNNKYSHFYFVKDFLDKYRTIVVCRNDECCGLLMVHFKNSKIFEFKKKVQYNTSDNFTECENVVCGK